MDFVSSVGWSSSRLINARDADTKPLALANPSYWGRSPRARAARSLPDCDLVYGSNRYCDKGAVTYLGTFTSRTLTLLNTTSSNLQAGSSHWWDLRRSSKASMAPVSVICPTFDASIRESRYSWFPQNMKWLWVILNENFSKLKNAPGIYNCLW